jgi:hypothetical protein
MIRHRGKSLNLRSTNSRNQFHQSKGKKKTKKINNPIHTITIDNYKDYAKQDIAEELVKYRQLCLELRKDN